MIPYVKFDESPVNVAGKRVQVLRTPGLIIVRIAPDRIGETI